MPTRITKAALIAELTKEREAGVNLLNALIQERKDKAVLSADLRNANERIQRQDIVTAHLQNQRLTDAGRINGLEAALRIIGRPILIEKTPGAIHYPNNTAEPIERIAPEPVRHR